MSGPYFTDETVTLWHGDCLDVLRELPDASVDAVVTDPPYGLEFMGKDWDRFGTNTGNGYQEKPRMNTAEGFGGYRERPNFYTAGHPFQAWCQLWASECLRALKPGGHMLAFGGTRTWHRLACAVEDAGFEIRDSIAWMYGSGFPKSRNLDGDWQGWGTALKPAFEPVVVARKPLVGTVAVNVLAHGTGALNIDGCRIETTDAVGGSCNQRASRRLEGRAGESSANTRYTKSGATNFAALPGVRGGDPSGRWPANVILDESQAAELDAQSGTLHSQATNNSERSQIRGDTDFGGDKRERVHHGLEVGGASRFFYVAKADQSERVRIDGIAHPTVKPLSLMRWLVRLVTPPGGTVLEPFAGSGTTVEACILEGFQCIAIEREDDYLPLIVQRINRRTDPVAAVRASGDDQGLFDLLDGGAA